MEVKICQHCEYTNILIYPNAEVTLCRVCGYADFVDGIEDKKKSYSADYIHGELEGED